LPEIDASLFQYFVQWIYFATLPMLKWYEDLGLCILGDNLGSDKFKNAVLGRI
jgi:hypothetical protein